MSTRTRRKARGETKTKAQRHKERWQAKVAAARDATARFAVKADRFRASVEWMVKRHSWTDLLGQHTDPAAQAQADALYEHAGDLLDQLADALDGGHYDQPGR